MNTITLSSGHTMQIPEGATFGEPQRPRARITGLMRDGVQPLTLANRVVLQEGQALGVTVQIELGGDVLPVNDTFAVPVCRVGGDIDQTVRALFVAGVAQLLVSFPRSGEYAVLPEWLNLHLAPEQQMDFTPFYISVTK